MDEITTSSPAFAKPLVVGSTVYLMDCVEGMKHYPDKYFDLAVVDPPYGINMGEQMATGWASKSGGTKFASKEWDLSIPEMEYFIELFRVSKEQIVWGGNYMTSFLPHSSCWLVWDKHNGDSLFADAELAWTSFKKPVRLKKYIGAVLPQNMKQVKIKYTQPKSL